MKTKLADILSKSMLKLILFLFISLFTPSLACTQTIEMERKFDFLRFTQNGEKLTKKGTMKLLKVNDEAFKHARISYNLDGFAFAFRFAGFISLTLALAGAADSKEGNWKAFAWGGGLILASIPFSVFSNKQIIKAVNIYNEGIATGNHTRRPLHFSVIGQGNEIGIRINF